MIESQHKGGYNILWIKSLWESSDKLHAFVGVWYLSVVSEVQKVAAEDSKCHLVEGWFHELKSIFIRKHRYGHEDAYQDLDKEDHWWFEEVVFQVFGETPMQSNSIKHANKGETV